MHLLENAPETLEVLARTHVILEMFLGVKKAMMYGNLVATSIRRSFALIKRRPQIKYKTLAWPMVAAMMTTEIVSSATVSLPSALAVVGMVPGLIIIVFFGFFATYTAWQLVRFKHRHPEVHTMGDAGLILFGPIGRDVLALGTIVFAVFATGSQLLLGQIAISALSDGRICPLLGSGESRYLYC